MKALTLHQPWASLIALGVKTIETRSWSTKYRGPLAIHAGAKRPRTYWHHDAEAELPPVLDFIAMTSNYEWFEHPDDPRSGGAYCWCGPLGAVVATCRLVDVVPMVEWARYRWNEREHPCLVVGPSPTDVSKGRTEPRAVLMRMGDGGMLTSTEVTDQRPYGDFTPARYAWLLEDIKPTTERCPACWDRELRGECGCPGPHFGCSTCDGKGTCVPVPARGRQGLWNWTP